MSEKADYEELLRRAKQQWAGRMLCLESEIIVSLRKAIDKIESLTAEVSALWELADSAVLASLKLDKKVGGELIRLRSNLGLSRDSGRHESGGTDAT